jgi:hypothetical protein
MLREGEKGEARDTLRLTRLGREGGGTSISLSECPRASLARSSYWKDYKECECMEKKAINIDSSRWQEDPIVIYSLLL